MNIDNFYDAWWFLYHHDLFKNKHGNSMFLHCLDVYVAKVNPNTLEIDDNEKKNTKVEIWLEVGGYDELCIYHDIDLDCGADTYEEAIIKLAKLVYNKYCF